jgi:hypothetical protein
VTDLHPDFSRAPEEKLPDISKAPEEPPIRVHSITNRSDFPFLSENQNYPQHKIINPFDGNIPDPRIDGNIVDLSGREQ